MNIYGNIESYSQMRSRSEKLHTAIDILTKTRGGMLTFQDNKSGRAVSMCLSDLPDVIDILLDAIRAEAEAEEGRAASAMNVIKLQLCELQKGGRH